MCVLLVVFLSSIVLHSVSAGGFYCAKTARDHAAALGLDYPGVHGAPDLSGPVHDGMHTDTILFNTDLELAETEPDVDSYRQNQPHARSLGYRIHKQTPPRGFESSLLNHGPYNPVQSEYTTDQVLRRPRGQSVINRKSNFEEVNHVAPPTLTEAPSKSDLVKWDPQGRNEPLSFVYNERDLVVDEFVPNRRGVSLGWPPLPPRRGHGTYQRGLTGYGLRREVPVLDSSGFTKDHIRAMTNQGPAVWRLKGIRFPGNLAQPLHRRLNVKQFVQGNPVLTPMTKRRSRPVRIVQ